MAAAGHFPTASEAFQVVTKAVQQGRFRDYEVVLEYAEGPDRSVPTAARKLSSLRQEKCGFRKAERQNPPAFRPPCGWQRIWRITHREDVLWDRQVHRCTLPLAPFARAGSAGSAEALECGFARLPAAVLARVVLSCDLPSLLSLAAALPALGAGCGAGAGTAELGQALPRGAAGAERWLSFARAALRWAELLGGMRQPGRRGKVEMAGDGLPAPCCSFSSCHTSEASCAAGLEAKLLATGHQDGVRLWGLPGCVKMGQLKTRSPVLALDVGGPTGDLLAVVMAGTQSQQFFTAAVYDLTSLNAAALWQLQVPSMVVHFLSTAVVLLPSMVGVQLLCAATGQLLENIDFARGAPCSSCKSPLPSSWYEAPAHLRSPQRNCVTVLLAARGKVLAVTESDPTSTTVQRSEVHDFPPETQEEITALSSSSTEVAAATSTNIFVWRLADRVLLAKLPAINDLDLENLSWSLSRAETLAGRSAIAAILLIEELLVCCVNLGNPGQDSAACALLAWHVPTCTRLPHPWHLAGPLESSPSTRAAATAAVLLPGISVGRLLADPSLRWVTLSHFESRSRQPVARILTPPLRR